MQPCVSICHCNRQALPAKSGTAHRKPPFTWQGSALLQPCRCVSVTLRMQGGDGSAREARASFAPRRNGGCYQKFATGVNPWVPRGLTSPPGNPASSRLSVTNGGAAPLSRCMLQNHQDSPCVSSTTLPEFIGFQKSLGHMCPCGSAKDGLTWGGVFGKVGEYENITSSFVGRCGGGGRLLVAGSTRG